MGNYAMVYLVLLATLFIGSTCSAVIFSFSGGGHVHVGDDLVLNCVVRNHDGPLPPDFYRVINGSNHLISPATDDKYAVYQNVQTIVDGGDFQLVITKASESDSGVYGCVLNVSGNLDWAKKEDQETTLTVQPAHAADPSQLSTSRTTYENQDGDEELKSRTDDGDLPQRPQPMTSTLAIVIAVLASVLLCIACAALWREKRSNRHRHGKKNPTSSGDVEMDVMETTTISDVTPRDTATMNPSDPPPVSL